MQILVKVINPQITVIVSENNAKDRQNIQNRENQQIQDDKRSAADREIESLADWLG